MLIHNIDTHRATDLSDDYLKKNWMDVTKFVKCGLFCKILGKILMKLKTKNEILGKIWRNAEISSTHC